MSVYLSICVHSYIYNTYKQGDRDPAHTGSWKHRPLAPLGSRDLAAFRILFTYITLKVSVLPTQTCQRRKPRMLNLENFPRQHASSHHRLVFKISPPISSEFPPAFSVSTLNHEHKGSRGKKGNNNQNKITKNIQGVEGLKNYHLSGTYL